MQLNEDTISFVTNKYVLFFFNFMLYCNGKKSLPSVKISNKNAMLEINH